MIKLIETYIVCDSLMNRIFKNFEGFTIDLGYALTERRTKESNAKFDPIDSQIQSHYINYKEIIQRYGKIGMLNVYNKAFLPPGELHVINNGMKMIYKYDEMRTPFDNVNEAIAKFREKFEVKVTEAEPVKEYVAPDKKLKEMTEAERIAYARNLR